MSQPARTAEEANKAHYDEFAVNYENLPDVFRLGSQVANEFKRIVQPNPEVTRVMEYACGTGVVSREIAPSVKSILGVDISQGMVDQFNKRGTDKLRAICVQQGTPLADQLNHETFDGIVCSMAYHHFADPAAVTRSLAESLAPKGTLVIADRVKFEGAGMSTHAADAPDDAVPHPNGFSEEQVREFFKAGGLVDCGFDRFKAIIFGNEVEMFAAYGKKPAAGEAGAL
ncbi:S-adenosyl-L-methionine-dependent methyltransferase [Schizophyllum commune]